MCITRLTWYWRCIINCRQNNIIALIFENDLGKVNMWRTFISLSVGQVLRFPVCNVMLALRSIILKKKILSCPEKPHLCKCCGLSADTFMSQVYWPIFHDIYPLKWVIGTRNNPWKRYVKINCNYCLVLQYVHFTQMKGYGLGWLSKGVWLFVIHLLWNWLKAGISDFQNISFTEFLRTMANFSGEFNFS